MVPDDEAGHAWHCAVCPRRYPPPVMRLHYQTLHDNTLADIELDDGVLVIRTGTSLSRDDRREVLKLTFADWSELVRAVTDLFIEYERYERHKR